MEAIVRKGRREDLPSVLGLIKELAEYERAPDEVVLTVQDLERDGFGEHPVFGFFVAEWSGKIVGMALYYIKYSTWKGKCVFLEDIIVSEPFRRSGIGKILFDKVAEMSRDMHVRRLEWQVLEWNEPAIAFYKKLGANFDSEWINCKLVYDQLQKY